MISQIKLEKHSNKHLEEIKRQDDTPTYKYLEYKVDNDESLFAVAFKFDLK